MSHSMKIAFENVDYYYMIGMNIAHYRRMAGLTQAQLAERAGVSRTHISFIEAPNMARPFSIELLFNIARVLNVPPYILLKDNKTSASV